MPGRKADSPRKTAIVIARPTRQLTLPPSRRPVIKLKPDREAKSFAAMVIRIASVVLSLAGLLALISGLLFWAAPL
jgi:hypothetical protein